MDWIVFLAMLLLAWFLASSGMPFLGFLVLILAALILVTSMLKSTGPRHSATPAGGGNAPVVIHTGGGDSIPSEMKIKVNPTWKSRDPWESTSNDIGDIINNVGKTLGWIFRGFKKP